MTENDVQNLSPAQYLLAAYDPDKPGMKKPNTKYNESEVHIAEDASHALNIRPLTAREGEDVCATVGVLSRLRKQTPKKQQGDKPLLQSVSKPTTLNRYPVDFLGSREYRNILDISMKQLASRYRTRRQ